MHNKCRGYYYMSSEVPATGTYKGLDDWFTVVMFILKKGGGAANI